MRYTPRSRDRIQEHARPAHRCRHVRLVRRHRSGHRSGGPQDRRGGAGQGPAEGRRRPCPVHGGSSRHPEDPVDTDLHRDRAATAADGRAAGERVGRHCCGIGGDRRRRPERPLLHPQPRPVARRRRRGSGTFGTRAGTGTGTGRARCAEQRLLTGPVPATHHDVSVRWETLGTYGFLAVDDPACLDAAHEIALDELAAVDRTCSRFRDGLRRRAAPTRARASGPRSTRCWSPPSRSPSRPPTVPTDWSTRAWAGP